MLSARLHGRAASCLRASRVRCFVSSPQASAKQQAATGAISGAEHESSVVPGGGVAQLPSSGDPTADAAVAGAQLAAPAAIDPAEYRRQMEAAGYVMHRKRRLASPLSGAVAEAAGGEDRVSVQLRKTEEGPRGNASYHEDDEAHARFEHWLSVFAAISLGTSASCAVLPAGPLAWAPVALLHVRAASGAGVWAMISFSDMQRHAQAAAVPGAAAGEGAASDSPGSSSSAAERHQVAARGAARQARVDEERAKALRAIEASAMPSRPPRPSAKGPGRA
jgi:hypothetical protein